MRRLTGPTGKGFHRVAWDLRYPPSNPTRVEPPREELAPWDLRERGPLAMPGSYRVSVAKRIGGVVTEVAGPQAFEVVSLNAATLRAPDAAAQLAFQQKTARLQRAVLGSVEVVKETKDRLTKIRKAIDDTPGGTSALATQAREIERRLADLDVRLRGDRVLAERNEPTPPSIVDRVQGVVAAHWATTQAPTTTMKNAYAIAADEFAEALAALGQVVEVDLQALQNEMEKAGAPWTPGRIPAWQKEE